MALCPFAKHLLIPAGSNDPRITPRVAILHVDAGNAFSLYEYFRDRSGGIESHFHIRNDGVIEQYRDTSYQADANNLANDFAVSIETQGYGAGEWNDLQLASIKRLLTWLSEVHDIPLKQCLTWDGSGVGYHTLFGAPSAWTPVAKSCPGEDRKKQFHNDIVPWLNGAERTWFDMATEADLRKIVREELDALLDTKQANDKTLRENIRIGANARDVAREILAALKGK
jgi:N-acetyl-anhydromuramyl-L-alanine amidase AmpD